MKKFLAMLLCAVMSIGVLAGCSSQETDSKKNEAQVTDNKTEWPLTIKHAFGETVIESKPERICTLGWGNQDTPYL